MENLVSSIDNNSAAANTIYANDKQRQAARMLLGSVGLMPQTKINERFEELDAKMSGLNGQMMEVLKHVPQVAQDMPNLLNLDAGEDDDEGN